MNKSTPRKVYSPFQTKLLGQTVYYFDTIDSTQTFLKNKLMAHEIDDGTVAVTDHQSAGKGTQGRSWFSLPKPQLMFSILLKTVLPPQKLPLLNLVSAIVLAELFSDLDLRTQIKWPNDLYIDFKKVAGILSELVVVDKEPRIIQGIGINIDARPEDFPNDLRAKVTALSLQTDRPIDRNLILEKFLQMLETLLSKPVSEIVSCTQEKFRSYWIFKDSEIDIDIGHRTLHGVANEIDSNGSLLLQTRNGLEKIVSGSILLATAIDKPPKNE